jgi:Uma2 family endonuclease
MLAEQLEERDDSPRGDQIVALHGATWADYQRLLKIRGDKAVPRITYLKGEIEIMTPSHPHETLKSFIGRLVEVWCLEHDVDFSPVGSWTLEDKEEEAGLEPDECYVFGVVDEPERPDLAIEVVWTSGGIKKLDAYKMIGVKEVWFWRRGKLTVHVLRGDAYEAVHASEVLPGIDLPELLKYVNRPTASQAIREYRAALQAQRR